MERRVAHSRRNSGRALAVLLGVTLWTTACRDTLSEGAVNPRPSTQPTAQLLLTPVPAGDSVITVDVRLNGFDLTSATTLPVSMTAAVGYDTTRLRFLSDVSPQDGALRAMHASRGRVMIAAANQTGLPSDVVARVRFVARDGNAVAKAPSLLTLVVTELHQADASDVRERTTVLPTGVIK